MCRQQRKWSIELKQTDGGVSCRGDRIFFFVGHYVMQFSTIGSTVTLEIMSTSFSLHFKQIAPLSQHCRSFTLIVSIYFTPIPFYSFSNNLFFMRLDYIKITSYFSSYLPIWMVCTFIVCEILTENANTEKKQSILVFKTWRNIENNALSSCEKIVILFEKFLLKEL